MSMTSNADTQAIVQHAIPSDSLKTNDEQMKLCMSSGLKGRVHKERLILFFKRYTN
jgi:hypothetical protein